MTEPAEALPLAPVKGLPQLPPWPGQHPLEVRDLSVAINGKITLQKVEVNVPDHQVVAVIGPSGAGKSTFLRALNRTLELIPRAQVIQGAVYFKGEKATGPTVPSASQKCR